MNHDKKRTTKLFRKVLKHNDFTFSWSQRESHITLKNPADHETIIAFLQERKIEHVRKDQRLKKLVLKAVSGIDNSQLKDQINTQCHTW